MNNIKNGKYITRAGNIFWYKEGLLHREDGPAVEDKNGWISWHYEGNLHRNDGTDEPAAIYKDGHKQWWLNGLLHRETGPAVIFGNGRQEWYLNGQKVTFEQFEQWRAKKVLNEKLHDSLAEPPQTKRGKI